MSVGNIGGGVLVAPYAPNGPMTARSWLMLGKARDLRFTSLAEQQEAAGMTVTPAIEQQAAETTVSVVSEASAPAGDDGADH